MLETLVFTTELSKFTYPTNTDLGVVIAEGHVCFWVRWRTNGSKGEYGSFTRTTFFTIRFFSAQEIVIVNEFTVTGTARPFTWTETTNDINNQSKRTEGS